MSFFHIEHLSAGYGGEQIIRDLSLDLPAGCLMGILGANASGKTTALKAICGILPHSGSCVLDGQRLEDLPPRAIARQCGYIPQRSGITIDISALDVVLMGFNPRLGLLQHPDSAMMQAAQDALTQVGLGNHIHANYLHLSEGQKQLCILARTLVTDSNLLLLDEPESALDFRYRYRMLELLKGWVRHGSRGAIVALHDPMLALNYCDKLLLLADGKAAGILSPTVDGHDKMEQMLEVIYGKVSLHTCVNRSGVPQLVMLKEESL